MNPHKLTLAPIQGITDFIFRNLFLKHFKGADEVYTPFVRLQNDGSVKKSQLKDILPENNSFGKTIPQILVNSGKDFIYLENVLNDLGYNEINLNLGCPYPMVAKRKLGSGLLPFPDLVRQLFDEVFQQTNMRISVKMRTGYLSETEILDILPVLNNYPLGRIIIHPRIGKQLYSGRADYDWFKHCMELSVHSLTYNGDIDSLSTFNLLAEYLNGINNWMIGRAAISNPFLFEEIKSGKSDSAEKKLERFAEFHNELFDSNAANLNGPGHLLNKMIGYWEYFSFLFPNPKLVYKKIKKSRTVSNYNAVIYEIFNDSLFVD
ncbi:MAG: tRNA-dihydrouridine synthase family protein [Bacteroidales bacterium]